MGQEQLIADYAAGPRVLADAVAGLTPEQLKTRCAPGQWSILEVVAHICDAELLYADRIKRVLAEDAPPLQKMDPDQFAARLAYHKRDLQEELTAIAGLRAHVARLLRTLTGEDFGRVGIHSADGPLTVTQLLERVTKHIPHHVEFIRGKRQALRAGRASAD